MLQTQWILRFVKTLMHTLAQFTQLQSRSSKQKHRRNIAIWKVATFVGH